MLRLGPGDGLHFVPLPYAKTLFDDYLPTKLTHDDYPDIIPTGQSIDTIAVSAVLIAFNWPKTKVDRYQRVQRFVEAFFPRIAEFRKPPHHAKWREVSLAAQLPGWTRLEAAQTWLDRQAAGAAQASTEQPLGFPRALKMDVAQPAVPNGSPPNDAELYREFLRWKRQQ